MITGFLFTIIYAFTTFLLNFLPDGAAGIPAQFISAFTLIVGYVNAYSWLLPVDQLFYALIFTVSLELVLMGFRISLWLLKLIRGA